jgi:5,10-methylenetetrahydromethanopterin reductase
VTPLAFGAGLFPTEPVPAMARLARVAEDAGFGHAWIGDSHLIWREAYVTLAAAALSTRRIVLGTGVTNVLTRDPAVIASAFATLHEACPGRVVLGVGLGDSAVETMGRKPARLDAFAEAVGRMRDLLAGREVTLETGTIRLKHAPGSGVPIYVAASGPRMLELAGRLADGVIVLVGVDETRVRQALDVVAAGARAAGRDPARQDLVLWVPCAVADDGAAARDAVKAHVARALNRPLPFALDAGERAVVEAIRRSYDYYGHMEAGSSQARVVPDWLVDRFAIAGAPAECRAAVDRLRGTGIRQLAVIPYGAGGGDREATLRRFAAAALD